MQWIWHQVLPLLLACSRHPPSSFADTAMTEAAMKNRIVVCSKTDLRVKKAVDRQSAKDFCRRVGCSYIEQCSNSGEGRDKLLQVPHICAAADASSLSPLLLHCHILIFTATATTMCPRHPSFPKCTHP